MKIRTSRETDHAAIHDFVENAFKTARVADGDEQDFVENLRKSDNFVPELELVGEVDGETVGHILLTRTEIATDSGPVVSLLLGPVATREDMRNRGLGSQLILAGLERAKSMGYESVVLVGDPGYYSRFGFVSMESLNIHNTNGIPAKFTQACELREGALQGLHGHYTFVGMSGE